jgi:hypothetical protein
MARRKSFHMAGNDTSASGLCKVLLENYNAWHIIYCVHVCVYTHSS